jgi:diguanylate cyclase (GGDEF)-like protein
VNPGPRIAIAIAIGGLLLQRNAKRGVRESTVLPGSGPVRDLPWAPPDEFKQRLRMRRFLLGSLFAVMYLLVVAIFSTQDKADRTTLIEACVIVAMLILAFYGAFRTGFNLRFSDPSLTGWQLLAAVGTMLFVVYRSPETRLAFTAFFFVALMFGMLRMSGRRLAKWGGISIIAFALVIWLRYANNGNGEMLRIDALLCAVMAVTFPWFVYIGERVKRLERGLTEAAMELDDVEESSWRDELTGVYNRRAINVALDEAKQQADATGEPLSLCVIDLDHFKRFNDELGHLAGDAVLRAFAHAVQSGLRAADVFGRYGGEEFVQILGRTDLRGALSEGERLRVRSCELDLPVPGDVGRLTVSIGIAQYQPGEKILQTFARADAALRKAKADGRNRVAS